ncbi:hypothetical protein [Streptomyces sp. AC495_CC817]|uniref:hypothetical protein n=1 Tax=Streptomyces sp. AC495_CC817 TaxID=2823900 RepID=UPI001C264AEE|nr:hypothetical protein [Streptomyces sp. AC495_CC817]
MIPLDPCPTEDSTNCFWDATQSGNALGESFFNYDGTHVLIQVPNGYYIEAVHVDPEHFFEPGYASGPGYGVTFQQAAPAATPTPTPTETGAATAQPDPTPTNPLAGTGIDLAPFVWVIVAALAVSALGLSLIGWHRWREQKKETR